MNFKLGTNIQVGHKIRTAAGWRKILSVTTEGAMTSDGLVKFGTIVHGWKIS